MTQLNYVIGAKRLPLPAEYALLAALVSASGIDKLSVQLGTVFVQAMNDGGMGSLRFVGAAGCRFGGKVAEAEFKDEDGTLVLATLYVDQYGDLFELDIFKGDFNRLISIPSVENMMIRRI